MRSIFLCLFFLLNPLLSFAAEVTVTDAYARATHKHAKAGAVFMRIRNEGEVGDALIGASSPISERAKLHIHSMDDQGVMRMREIDGSITLPGRNAIRLEPGGMHVMLLGINRPLIQGNTFPLTLSLRSGRVLDILVEVIPLGQRMPDTHQH